jgi:hypothetical protein
MLKKRTRKGPLFFVAGAPQLLVTGCSLLAVSRTCGTVRQREKPQATSNQ